MVNLPRRSVVHPARKDMIAPAIRTVYSPSGFSIGGSL